MSGFESFVGALRRRVAQDPTRKAIRYWTADGVRELDYADLDLAARTLADRLRTGGAAPGDRVLLSCGPGTTFIQGFLGCLYAGTVPVPVPAPGGFGAQEARTTAIAADTGAQLVLTDGPTEAAVAAALPELERLTVERAGAEGDPANWSEIAVHRGDLCFLQYTSGSTSDPKGVMVPHGALVHNLGLMRDAHGWDGSMTWCSWLPPYHDMGLIAMMLAPLYLGGSAVLMSATDFLKRPVSWLRLIDRYGAEVSCAPNFAYELCARRLGEDQTASLDLSRWRYACNGAEPVDAATLARFADRFAGNGFKPQALLPGYGLAESTLYVSGTPADELPAVLLADPAALDRGELLEAAAGGPVRELAGSGVVRGLDVRIVDPDQGVERPDGQVGEIWIRGESVALGYWNRPDDTARTFGAHLADDTDRTGGTGSTGSTGSTGDAGTTGGFLRTGDLGALLDGQLYVTGRLKEMIISHGRNLYPHDIERTVRDLEEAFDGLNTAVFSVRPGTAAEEIVVVQEVRGRGLTDDALAALARRTRSRLAARLGIRVGGVALVRMGRVRRTTSGKIRRAEMRRLFEAGELEPLCADLAPGLEPRPARLGVPAGGDGPWDPYALTAELERRLGDPRDPARAFSFARCAELDRAEEFPAEICRELDGLGLPGWFAPVEHGGELRSAEDLLQIIRTLGRRDFTVALGHTKTYLGAVSAWVAGTPAQAAALAARVREGAVVSLALTERAHGSDLLAGELTAVRTANGWRLDGEKWLINNATRADLVCVLARTGPEGGTRGFSLLLVDKARLTPGSWRPLPAVSTHGVRGADISGIAFDGAEVPADALIGAEGEGLEIILKGFQITRTLCSAMSLGMADQALRTAVEFARTHRLYNRPLTELPHAARTLAESYADLLAMEAAGLLATRSVHTLTEEQSAVSAVVKYLVPTLGDQLIGALRGLLGARAMLVDDHAHGVFQKIERDHRIVGIFDGSTAVNLNSLINQFPVLARGWRKELADLDGVRVAARLDGPVPALDHDRLTLYSRNGGSVVQSLPEAVRRLSAVAPPGLVALAERLLVTADELHRELAAQRPAARAVPAAAFALARRYALLYAAAAILWLWLENQDGPAGQGGLIADPRVPEAVLTRLLRQLSGEPDLDDNDGPALDALLPLVHRQYERGHLFSLLQCSLADAEGATAETEESA
ncbi:AMP-binding protein [Streptomyces sp. E11-3]|uniref:AMP-binding protein n=1 Tax=Streptomyces sp. E11-3 TaxID=3110112 RepID=UPI00397EF52E